MTAQTTIANQSTIANSTVTVTTHIGDIHQPSAWQPRWEPSAEDALALLGTMPRDDVPPVSSLPGCARMPFAPNPHFVGRDAPLLALAAAFQGDGRTHGPRVAITGLGGLGKTSVAAEFVHRYGSYFAGGVFWLSFAVPAAVAGEVAACGGPGLLDLHPRFGDLKVDEQVQLVRQSWQKEIPRLLIFDNCDDPQLVQQWAPVSGGCRVLITSRRHAWPRGLRIRAQSLAAFQRAASLDLLQDLAPRLRAAEADALAETLGDFPLALHLAGSYLDLRQRLPVASYLADLRGANILAHPSLRDRADEILPTSHAQHVGRTLLLSYQGLAPAAPRDMLARQILCHAGWCAPGEAIPLDVLFSSLPAAVSADASEEALAQLISLGLLDLVGESSVRIHRLVQAFIQAVAPDPTAAEAVAAILIAKAHVINEAWQPAPIQPLLPHLRWQSDHGPFLEQTRVRLLHELTDHSFYSGDYGQALALAQRALAASETAPPTLVAQSLNNLASLYHTQGDGELARPIAERALGIIETALGPDHADTASHVHNLAHIDQALRDYPAARRGFARALAIRQHILGPDHPLTANSIHDLAYVLCLVEDYATALPLAERALASRERTLGPDHPSMADSLYLLAKVHRALGHLTVALPLGERALAIAERTLGPTHYRVTNGMLQLAAVLAAIGETARANALYEEALARHEAAFGPFHPLTMTAREMFHDFLVGPPPE